MCGIVGYIGSRDATAIILNGLKRLEYRGYDSAGLAVLQDGQIQIRRDAGKLSRLQTLVDESPLKGHVGIGHTRWATHGEPSARNAHPHLGMTGDVVVVHNGIVENFIELRQELAAEGAVFKSETDSEVIVHLVERHFSATGGLAEAVRQALTHLKGAHGIVVFSAREPDKIIAARIGNAGGVVIGLGEGEMFIASDLPAILEHTRKVIFLESRQLAVVTQQGVQVQTLEGKAVNATIHHVAWDPVSAEKGEYRHFMAK
jgi:glucosamine--fructose-6-phosphate aminotransferase (isomerizing)